MKLKNPIMFFLFLFFVVLNVIDYLTAMYILPGESNPIFLATGSIHIVGLLKLALIVGILFIYKHNTYKSHLSYYMIIMVLVLSNILLGVGIWSNVYALNNPDILIQASTMTTHEKSYSYFKFMNIIYMIPAIAMIIIFILYDKSLTCVNFVSNKKSE